MAQKSRLNFKAKEPILPVFEFLSNLLHVEDIDDVRVGHRDFSRDGKLSPELLVTILLFMAGDGNRSGYAHVLSRFWDQAEDFGIKLPSAIPVSAASLCDARGKLAAQFLRTLVHDVHAKVESDFPDTTEFRGCRVFAVDGCKVNLRRSPELDRAFGRPSGGHVPQALMSVLVNVCNRVPADVAIRGYASCERSILLEEHLQFLESGDILVLDRGYPSYEVVRSLLDAEVDFLVRVPASSTFPAIDGFLESGRQESVVTLELPRTRDEDRRQVRLRAARIETADGPTVFLTSLPRARWSWSTLCQLYRMRWQAEELYKTFKADYFDQRQFHSKQTAGVQQEIFATMLFLGISRYLMAAAAEVHDCPLHEVSQKASVLGFADYLLRIFRQDPQRGPELIRRLLARIARHREKHRPHRSFPRRSFRPSPRWGATGRRGA
jgi:hypothetical protein